MLSDAPTGFVVFFCVVMALVVAGFVLTAYSALRNRSALKRAGYDPITAPVQMVDRFLSSQQHPTLESRLAELADLHARGVISDEEHTAARAQALAQP